MQTVGRPGIPSDALRQLRLICLDLPEAYEETAWAGVRWMVGKKNFAHVLMIEADSPRAYARAANTEGPACVLTFRLPRRAIDSLRFRRRPFFRPVWFANIAGVVLDTATDWDVIADLLIDSYCVLAPKRLRALLDRPGGRADS